MAREAGVGIATVLRRFRAKEELAAAVFADRMDVCAYAIAVAVEDSTPGTVSSAESRPPA
ncbi:hypothetical protein [Streptomyces sp. NPDC050759]|uniref:hypothetical protein n=1 Tax=Streptomyces sp. NPDC050759 TaxID=3365635 RepID=UPI003795CA79